MKILITFLVVVLATISCETQNIVNEKLATDLGQISSIENATYYKTTGIINNSAENEVVIGLKNQDSKNFNRVLILQLENNSNWTQKKVQLGLIEFESSALFKIDEEFVFIGLDNDVNTQLINRLERNHNISISKTILGFGFSKVTGEWDIENANFSDNDVFSILEAHQKIKSKSNDTSRVAATCTSGGTGSSSCSTTNPLTGCGVTCNTGYYSCCDASVAKCTCIKEPTKKQL